MRSLSKRVMQDPIQFMFTWIASLLLLHFFGHKNIARPFNGHVCDMAVHQIQAHKISQIWKNNQRIVGKMKEFELGIFTSPSLDDQAFIPTREKQYNLEIISRRRHL